MTKKMELDYETADRITVLNLKDYREQLKKELKSKGRKKMHPGDVESNTRVIEALDLLLKQFGE